MKKDNEMFQTMFKSISKFRICSYFMHLKVLIWEQYEIVFLKILPNQKSHAGKDGLLERN